MLLIRHIPTAKEVLTHFPEHSLKNSVKLQFTEPFINCRYHQNLIPQPLLPGEKGSRAVLCLVCFGHLMYNILLNQNS